MFAAGIDKELELPLPIAQSRFGWSQVTKGKIMIGEHFFEQGDGLAFQGGDVSKLRASAGATLLLFEMA